MSFGFLLPMFLDGPLNHAEFRPNGHISLSVNIVAHDL